MRVALNKSLTGFYVRYLFDIINDSDKFKVQVKLIIR